MQKAGEEKRNNLISRLIFRKSLFFKVIPRDVDFLMPFFIIILFAQQHHSWKGKKWTAGMTKLQPLTGEQCIITGPLCFLACMDQRDWLGRGSSERKLISCPLLFRNCTLEGKKIIFIIACLGMIIKGAYECVISRSHLFSSSFFTG